MSSSNSSFISIVDYNKNKVSWKRSKGLVTNFAGLLLIIGSLVLFSGGVVILMTTFLSNNPPSKEIIFGIPIIINLLIIFLDITFVSLVYKQPDFEGYKRIESVNELISKPKQFI